MYDEFVRVKPEKRHRRRLRTKLLTESRGAPCPLFLTRYNGGTTIQHLEDAREGNSRDEQSADGG
jgi:hypothetical protein